jgi:hypothetical protein
MECAEVTTLRLTCASIWARFQNIGPACLTAKQECVSSPAIPSARLDTHRGDYVAQRTIIQLTDDLDGKPIAEGKGETVAFAIDGTDYEIDLGDKNAAGLRDTFAKYVGAARKVSGRSVGRARGRSSAGSRSRASSGRDYDPSEVREWAKAQGIEVNGRGRVPSSLVLQFQEANK